MIRRLTLTFVLAALCSGLAAQQDTSTDESRSRKSAAKVSIKTENIRGMPWYGSLEGAIAANKKARKKRPILHLRMLGDLKGKT